MKALGKKPPKTYSNWEARQWDLEIRHYRRTILETIEELENPHIFFSKNDLAGSSDSYEDFLEDLIKKLKVSVDEDK